MIPKTLRIHDDFPPTSYEQWRTLAESELKGAPFDKKLVAHTYEGIDIQPLYTSDHIFSPDANNAPTAENPSGFPGFAPMIRGSRPLGAVTSGWDIRQEHLYPDPAQVNRDILNDLMHGVTSIHLKWDAAGSWGRDADARDASGLAGCDGVMISSRDDLNIALANVRLDIAGVALDAGGAFLPAAALYVALAEERGVKPSQLLGAFQADPLGSLARDGHLPGTLDEALGQMTDLAVWTARHAPQIPAVEICTSPYHHAGASSTQDLACAIATGIEYLRILTNAGLDLNAAAKSMVFSDSLGCQFFKAIAKIRALRLLWSRVLSVCSSGGEKDAIQPGARIRARTSRRIMTTRDPWVNLLRNTAACFAAAVGGAEVITTLPFDAAFGHTDHFGRHLARNTQLMLMEESYLHRVVDPAGGSWYLESLTQNLAAKAWELVQQIEAQGGMQAAVTSGWIAGWLDATQTQRAKNVATRKEVITGVNDHPDVAEEKLTRPNPDMLTLRAEAGARLVAWRRDHRGAENALQQLRTAAQTQGAGASGTSSGSLFTIALSAARSGATLGQIASAMRSQPDRPPIVISPLAVHPYGEAFEALRDAADELTLRRQGMRPGIFLANLGSTPEFLARATFSKNFFESGGLAVINGTGGLDDNVIVNEFQAARTNIAILCSTDKLYESRAAALAPLLKAAGARTLFLAGAPGDKEAKYRAAGIDRFIFMKCDVVGTLKTLLREEGANV